MVKSKDPFFSILSLGVFFCIFLKKKFSIPLSSYVLLRSLIFFYIYLTEVDLICKNSQAYLLCIYCLIKTGSEEGNVILLDQRLWKLKPLSTLAGILWCSRSVFGMLRDLPHTCFLLSCTKIK